MARALKYRGAIVEDLDPPAALSLSPNTTISHAILLAYERDYTHLTVTTSDTRALMGYIDMPKLHQLLQSGQVRDTDTVDKAMVRFRRKGNVYRKITLDTPLADLEAFFEGSLENGTGEKQDFAVVTDDARKFVLGVATKADLENFVKRRAA